MRDSTAMASSLSGHKRRHAEQEIDFDCTCVVCFEVLLDPVALPCGHALDQRCLQRMMAAGQRACPTCRQVLPAIKFSVSVLLRNVMQQRYPEQVPISRIKPLLLKGGRWPRHGRG